MMDFFHTGYSAGPLLQGTSLGTCDTPYGLSQQGSTAQCVGALRKVCSAH